MAKIWIEPSKAKSVLTLENSIKKTLNSMSSDVDGIRGRLRYKIAAQEQIAARLKDAVEQLKKESVSTEAMRTGLEQVIARYERAENSNRECAVAEKTSVQQEGGVTAPSVADNSQEGLDLIGKILEDILTLGPDGTWDFSDLPFPISPFLPWIVGQVTSGGGDHSNTESSFFPTDGKVDNEHGVEWTIKRYNDKKNIDNFPAQKHYYKDLTTGEITEVDPSDQKAMEELKKKSKNMVPVNIKVAGIGASGSAAIYEQTWDGQYGVVGHEGSVSAFKAEGHADAYIGMLAAGASIGGSITAFSAREKAYLGTEDVNIYGEVGTTVGRVGVNAGVNAGLLNKDGKFDPSLYAGASAEAIAGEVTGKVGVDLGIADVGVEGSLNYGIGAHANVGFNDGVLSVDVGATLGVGGSVKLDIDVSGAVDAVAEAADEIWSGITGLFS